MSGSEGSGWSWPISARLTAAIATPTFSITSTYALLRNTALSKSALKLVIRISDRRLLFQWSGLAALAAASTAITVNAVLIRRKEKKADYDDLCLKHLYRLSNLGTKLSRINKRLAETLSVLRSASAVSEENLTALEESVRTDIDNFRIRQDENIEFMKILIGAVLAVSNFLISLDRSFDLGLHRTAVQACG